MKRVLITGITGQDGYYLARLAHERGYQVYGLIRGQNNPKRTQVEAELPFVTLIEGDLMSEHSLCRAYTAARPHYVFNLAAITYIPLSWEQPELTYNVNFLGVSRMLEEAANHNVEAFVQASTSEMYGDTSYGPHALDESSSMNPISPYAVAKLAAHHLVKSYRRAGIVNATSAIMFNHESPRRGESFVTRKIARAAVRIARGEQDVLKLGANSTRDWGYAPEYMEGLLRIAETKTDSDSFVFATGQSATVKEFALQAFAHAGASPSQIIFEDERFLRENDVPFLRGNASRAKAILGWEPATNWATLAQLMVDAEMESK